MKTSVTTIGFLAVGAASLHAIYAPELDRLETAKTWTVAVSLRGFYDDNWASQSHWALDLARNQAQQNPNLHRGQVDAFGFEARPYLAANILREQDYYSLSYLGSYRYNSGRSTFYDESNLGLVGQQTVQPDPWDYAHDLTAKWDHTFSPRYRLRVMDTFTYGISPDLFNANGLPITQSPSQDYIQNFGTISFSGQFTDKLGYNIRYDNTLYDYLKDGNYAASLNRDEYAIPVDIVRWQVQPDLVTLVQYQFQRITYRDGLLPYTQQLSQDRNSSGHVMALGADYDFNPQLRGSLRAGGQYRTYDNVSSADGWSPYVDASLSWLYSVGSHADLSFKHIIAAPGVVSTTSDTPVLDQEASVVSLFISQRLSPRLTGNILAEYSWSTYNGSSFDGMQDRMFLMAFYINYRLPMNLPLGAEASVELGYNFSLLDSGVTIPFNNVPTDVRSYDRNMVYLGFRAQF